MDGGNKTGLDILSWVNLCLYWLQDGLATRISS